MPAQRNIRLVVAYDGTEYAGWQVQPELRTVQGVIEEGIELLTGERVRVLSAGRTDAGVHALAQVVSFYTQSPIPPEKWRPALQAKLPPDIVIRRSDQVAHSFHATFSAVSKRYRYVILNHLVDDPFTRRYCWRLSQPQDVPAMHAAAQLLVGKHDFRSFESDWPNKATSVRTVTHLSVRRAAAWGIWQDELGESMDGDQPYIVLEIEADGFLYNMVRAITGTLVNVGRGTWSGADVERILKAYDRQAAGATAPACGLFLVRVTYPEEPLGGEGGDGPVSVAD